MKKTFSLFLCLTLLILLAGCGKKTADQADASPDIFPAAFHNGVTSIEFHNFDETVLTYTDASQIRDVLDCLESAQCRPAEESEYLEGFYSFTFVAGDDSIPVGLSTHTLAIGGTQYVTDSVLSDEVIRILNISFEEPGDQPAA